MNSEELEQSLRAEFESYLKDVVAKMREDVNEFQKQIESEFEKHRSHLDDSFLAFANRFDTVPEFDGGFRETVIEHLRLARDEGAQITAAAMAEAEDLERAAAPTAFDLSEIKDALEDISSKDTQSAILKSLIQHAAKYSPRGAFFIIKNEHFAGWKVFGKEAGAGEAAVREIHFPIASDSILGESVRALKTVEASIGTHSDDSLFLDPLNLGQPDRMYAIPLIARGRGVAVLYTDYGNEGVVVNTDALEMLVKVAGLTVELLASTKAVNVSERRDTAPQFEQRLGGSIAPSQPIEQQHDAFEAVETSVEPTEEEFHTASHDPGNVSFTGFDENASAESLSAAETELQPEAEWEREQQVVAEESNETQIATDTSDVVDHEPVAHTTESSYDFRSEFDAAPEYVPETLTETAETLMPSPEDAFIGHPVTESMADLEHPIVESTDETAVSDGLSQHEVPVFNSDFVVPATDDSATFHTVESAMSFDESSAGLHGDVGQQPFRPSISDTVPSEVTSSPEPNPQTAGFESTPFDTTAARFETANQPNGSGTSYAPAAAPDVAARPPVGRLSDRNVDLPIEVADEERRLHNDARRFARLLVSEIKLYNEKKVQEGRESNDLYERLREAIDRSREMYDKRVQPPVASKFDYFHYELVNSLAEGDEGRLGRSYKGASV